MTFGEVLRTWRERVTPAAVGLRTGASGRRTPGLRREELAMLAGVSPDYVKRLEQGHARPSSPVVRALARALRVSTEEHDLLARLAGHAPPPAGTVPQYVTPGVQRLADRLSDVPVGIFDATWTLLMGNEMWSALFGDQDALEGRDRNTAWQFFTGAETRVRHTDPERTAGAFASDLQAAVLRYPADQQLAAMIEDLRATSDRFAELWAHPVGVRQGGQLKRIAHPVVGELLLNCDVLTVHDADVNMVVFTAPPHTSEVEKLALLAVTGVQELSTSD